MKTVSQLRRMTDPYGSLPRTDCVGLCQLLHYVLNKQGIGHEIRMGCNWDAPAIRNLVSGVGFSHHMWIELKAKEGSAVIDYRARQWVGSIGNTPHGIFLKREYPHMVYTGQKIEPIYPEWAVMWAADPEHYPYPGSAALQQVEQEAARGVMREWDTRDGGRFFPLGDADAVTRIMSQGA